MLRLGALLGLAAALCLLSSAAFATERKGDAVIQTWRKSWEQPGPELRPLQIVHGAIREDPQRELTALKEMGLGGVVANVPSEGYLQSEQGWREFTTLLATCKQLRLRVWIYDEDGYPSGSAGGLVLKEHPEYEALALAYDAGEPDPFQVRPAYEHTHATHNYSLHRRFPNLIDDRAVASFLRLTYDAYYEHAGADFGGTIEAFFTDEPSLLDANLGEVPPEVEKAVAARGGDPVDPSVKALPTVAWAYDLEARYRERYHEDLLPLRRSLFEGDSPRDQEIRRRYWALVADLFADRFMGGLQRWCHARGVAASGHLLGEEVAYAKIPLEGNALENLRRLDIPGMDLLSSNPRYVDQGWVTPLLPASAALHMGRRRVMTEVSALLDKPDGGLPWMKAAAAWEAALGVTEFTLYYQPAKPSPADYRAYTDYVGRLNAVLREARPDPHVLLYYPATDLMQDYLPVATSLWQTPPTSPRARQIVDSFGFVGQWLVQHQVSFALADTKAFDLAHRDGAHLRLGQAAFDTLVLPASAELPNSPVLRAWLKAGGHLLRAEEDQPATARLLEPLPSVHLDPPSQAIVLGQFLRDSRPVLLLANGGDTDYTGLLALPGPPKWERWDPDTGAVTPLLRDAKGRYVLVLPKLSAVLLVEAG